MDIWTDLLLALGLLVVVAAGAWAATRRLPEDYLSEGLGQWIRGRGWHGPGSGI